MIKNKKTQPTYNKITTIFGYSLFAATALSFIATTAIPLLLTLNHSSARHFTIATMAVVFAIAVILPALASYLIGDKATRGKNKLLHHYNGVMFGVAAFWLALLCSGIMFIPEILYNEYPFPAPLVITNIVPVILSIVIMSLVAITYTKRKAKDVSVLYYRPLQIVLIGSVIGAISVPIITSITMLGFNSFSVLTFAIPGLLTSIAYWLIAKKHDSRLARLSEALFALTTAWVTGIVAQSLLSLSQVSYDIAGYISVGAGLVAYVAYIIFRRR